MKVLDLGKSEVSRRLSGSGMGLRIGPYVLHLQSPIKKIAEGVAILYADYPVVPDGGFSDFHVRVTPPWGLRRWYRPKSFFLFDGHAPFTPLPLNQSFPFLEWGLNWCVHNHLNQHLIIHAAVLERGGRAVLLPGPPGSGKSTLCAALACQGWRLLSDELALVSLKNGDLTPFPRPISLKNESIDIIRQFAPGVTIGPASADTAKGRVAHMKAPADSVARMDQKATPHWVIFPKYRRDAKSGLTDRSKAATALEVAKNAFNYNVHGTNGFESLTNLIDSCACFQFEYSDLNQAMAVISELDTASQSAPSSHT